MHVTLIKMQVDTLRQEFQDPVEKIAGAKVLGQSLMTWNLLKRQVVLGKAPRPSCVKQKMSSIQQTCQCQMIPLEKEPIC